MVYLINQAINKAMEFAAMQDPRAAQLPFTSLISLTTLTTVYLGILITVPKLMATRRAFVLRGPILLYNLAQMFLNGYLLTNSIYELANHPLPYNFACAAPNTNDQYYSRIEFNSVYAYHVIKIVDLLDTVFFVLRKKSAQLSFLHVYHHVAVLWGTSLIVNFSPGGHFVFLGLCNMFVHTIMYGYYFASLYEPEVKNSLAVKKCVTLVQMAQFVILIVHSGIPLVMGTPCETPRTLLAICITQNMFLLVMFSDFYIRNYIVRPQALRKNTK